jgi:hypothetical protein
MKLSQIESNVNLEEEGVWVTMTGGWEAKVRSTNCKAYRDLNQRIFQKNRRFYARRQAPPPETQDQDTLRLVVETLLVDWRGLEDENGEPIPCTPENATEILGDRRYAQMLSDVSDAAQELETFRVLEEEADLGN